MLNEILIWWSRQMLDLLPERVRKRSEILPHALIVEPGWPGAGSDPLGATTPPHLHLVVRRKHRERDLGTFRLDDPGIRAAQAVLRRRTPPRTVVLRLSPGAVLERRVVLPLAAERDIGRVLAYEMDRNTPFSSEEVFWTWATDWRDPPHGRLHVRLSLVPKAAVSAILAASERAGAVPTLLEAAPPSGAPRVIGLHRSGTGPQRWLRRGTVAAGAACALLAAAAIVLPFVLQSIERDTVERELARVRPRVAQVEALRREIAARTAGVDVFSAEGARVGRALEVLAAVTEILPDDTFLTELTLRDGKLGLVGQSGAATRLIAALSADPAIRNPAFAAPVTRIENGRADQFSIRAEITR